jgi:hypothetical protein
MEMLTEKSLLGKRKCFRKLNARFLIGFKSRNLFLWSDGFVRRVGDMEIVLRNTKLLPFIDNQERVLKLYSRDSVES